MKIDQLKQRLRADRPMTSVTLRMPQNVVDDLKRIAPQLGFSGYQTLMRAYIGQGLRSDLERFDEEPIARLIDNLKLLGVSDDVLDRAVRAAAQRED